MNRQIGQRGFTLIEVVLAIAVGLIIIAGVSVGYRYAKSTAIVDNQRKDAAMIKAFVEQAITSQEADRVARAMPWLIAGYMAPQQWVEFQSGEAASSPSGRWAPWEEQGRLAGGSGFNLCPKNAPPCISIQQLLQLGGTLPSLKVDPYTGAQRVSCVGSSTNSCVWSPSDLNNHLNAEQMGIDLSGSSNTMSGIGIPGAGAGITGSQVVYLNFGSYDTTATVNMADGTTLRFSGYMVLEADDQGSIIAAAGGEPRPQVQQSGSGTT